MYSRFYDQLGVPYVITKRPPWDTFAGAEYSVAFDTLAPDGRTLQIGTAHLLGQNFSEVYDLTFETLDGEQEHVWQTSYGISDRAIASLIMVHGDDNGLCLPPELAPIQVVIVPIPYQEEEADVHGFSEEIKEELQEAGMRVELDTRDLRPGDKYYRWERRGVPLRIEVGPNEVEEGKVTFVRRDTGKRVEAPRESLVSEVEENFEAIFRDMKERAKSLMEERIFQVDDVKEAKELLDDREGIVKIPWCGKEECGLELEDETGGDFLGREIDGEEISGECPICGEKADRPALMAKTF